MPNDNSPAFNLSMAEIEIKFAEGEWSHGCTSHVRSQLLAEGVKRTEAFVFEDVFQKVVRRSFAHNPDNFSTGWIACFYFSKLQFWFRFETEGDKWNRCDDAFAAELLNAKITIKPNDPLKDEFDKPVKVFRVTCDVGGTFFFEERKRDRTFKFPVKQEKFRGEYKITGTPRVINVQGRNPERQKRAISVLEIVSGEEMKNLSQRRRLMNSVLPGMGFSPIDLDAVFLNDSTGKLNYVEFKRKYPADSRKFGIDKAHVEVAELMKKIGIGSLLLMLVSPVWTDNESPVRWYLDMTKFGHRWAWVIATMTNIGGKATMFTTGEKSGQRGGERSQLDIEWDDCRLLSSGITVDANLVEKMRVFFSSGDLSEHIGVDYDSLCQLTDCEKRNMNSN